MAINYAQIDNWIFDLDNTLYPHDCDLFALIDDRMRGFIGTLLNLPDDEAHALQKSYFRDHGTTLAGLMAYHAVDPDHFLEYVHDIDLSRLNDVAPQRDSIDALVGRKIIFTNGNVDYAQRVLDALDLGTSFDSICGIDSVGFVAKPDPRSFDRLIEHTQIDPTRSIFIDDMARNLTPAKAIGMQTIWVNNGSEYGSRDAHSGSIDLEIYSISDWLQTIVL